MLKKARLFFVLFLFVIILASCATNPVTGKQELMLISESQEIEMGRTVFPNAMWGAEGGGGEYKDERLKAYLGDIVTRLHKSSHRPNLPVSFAIQNSSIPNAWAIPGYVVITRGLLSNLDNEAEFAFVLGHEIGHVSARHSARQMSQAMLLQLGLGITALALSNKDYGELVVGLGYLGGIVLLRKYSRDDEFEADRLGVEYMTRIGYNPKGAVSAHRRLQQITQEYARSIGQEPSERTFFEELLATHPRTQTRIEEIERLIQNYRAGYLYGDGANSQRYQSMINDIKRVNNIYVNYYDKAVRAYNKGNLNEAQNYLHHAINQDRNQAPFYALTGFVMLDRKNYQEAERYFNGALTLDKNYQPAYRGFGMISYAQKDFTNAITHFNKALRLYPDDTPSHYYVGMSYYRTNNCRKAVDHLSKVAEVMPKHQSINGYIGMCYDKLGDVENAYRYYAAQVKLDNTSNIGRLSLNRFNEINREIERQRAEKDKQKRQK
ncbi:MAG: M48 family metalloprotease [Thermodesulfovibrionales bacterium]|nr:M48 family metalloprotease [Thermodesulfovibrionales bacterium]